MFTEIFKINKKWLTLFVLPMLLFVTSSKLLADVVIVSHPEFSIDSISAKEAKKIWLGKTKQLAGVNLKPVDQPKGSAARDHFYKTIVRKNEKQLKAYWAKIVFSGKGNPPKTLDSDADVINWVNSTPGAFGYVDSTAVSDSVKVLMISK